MPWELGVVLALMERAPVAEATPYAACTAAPAEDAGVWRSVCRALVVRTVLEFLECWQYSVFTTLYNFISGGRFRCLVGTFIFSFLLTFPRRRVSAFFLLSHARSISLLFTRFFSLALFVSLSYS